ncbi:MAG: ABC-2 transporter permease [Clostridia bacterium]|nr:ABC-2 transporter permease [Clostridia bacterium]
MKAIYKRELKAYFTSPLAYVFIAVFFLFEGIAFTEIYSAGVADVTGVFFHLLTMLAMIFLTPVLTMRLLSEDRRQKVDQALLTAPVGITGIVLGKFLAAFTVFALAFAPTVIFQIIVSALATSVNWLFYLNALLGVLLTGAALISIGLVISSLTESQAISCILTITAYVSLFAITYIAELTGQKFIIAAAEYLAIFDVFSRFGDSVFHIPDVAYLLSVTALFIFLSVRAVERRRWA